MKDTLRIALISEHASPLATLGGVDAGGQNIYVNHVARTLARAGHQVDVLTRRDDPHLPPVVDLQPGLRVIHIPAGPASFVRKEALIEHMPEFALVTEKLMRGSVPYDVAHANFFMSGMVAQRLKASFGLPFVMTFHALGRVRKEHQKEADGFPAERGAIEESLVRDADAVVAECPQDKSDLVRLYGADPASLWTVPCGYDPLEFSPLPRSEARRQLGLDPEEFIVLQLGRLVPRKGIDNVIRSLAALPRGVPARLLVVGGDSAVPDETRTPEIARLRQVARDCGVEARVTFTGQRQRSELRTYYAASDVFVTTPWYEPFGITPLEAMACGVPVVGSAVGGIQYSVADGVAGFLVPPNDPVALAARLAQLHANPALASALGRGGIQRARSMFTWRQVARDLARVYAAVCRKPVHVARPPVTAPWSRTALIAKPVQPAVAAS